MHKTAKYLKFQSLKLQLQHNHPKQVSRAVLCLKDQHNNLHRTSTYGQVTPQAIHWDGSIEIPYNSQEVFRVETVCQHEYGYKLEELQAMYYGQIYVKTESFFRPLAVHVYDSQGAKCGLLRYLIKVVERQEGAKFVDEAAEVVEQAVVQVDLVGKVTLYAASVTITSPAFKKQKYVNELELTAEICGHKLQAAYKKNFEWSFSSNKIDYMEDSPRHILFAFRQGSEVILAAETDMQSIIENKRFVTQTFNVYNEKEQKVGALKLDLRFITKQEILDLMYSPNKLSKNRSESTKEQQLKLSTSAQKNRIAEYTSSLKKQKASVSRMVKGRSNSSMIQSIRKSEDLKSAYSHAGVQLDSTPRSSNRYKKVHVTNSYNQIIFPKEKRFTDNKYVNPYVSYCDPVKLSDFSPNNKNGYQHRKGPDIGLSKKSDFTRQYRHNPGVGEYKLPSIWDKY